MRLAGRGRPTRVGTLRPQGGPPGAESGRVICQALKPFLRFSAINQVGTRVRLARFDTSAVRPRDVIRSMRNLGYTSILPIPLRAGKKDVKKN